MRYSESSASLLLSFFFNDTASTDSETYLHTLSLHDALPISWEPSSDQTYYASFSRGIKGVGFNNGFSAFGTLAANVATLGPVGQEVLDAFELGAKNRFFDRRLSVNTALFYYQYEGKQAGRSVYDGFVAT